MSFHDVLSALNPLQYLPVIGTIYRAATGDLIPEPVRRLGSLLVSGLLGGPVGVAINLATMAAEKIAGIDLDGIGQSLLHGRALAATDTPVNGRAQTGVTAWTPTQRAAYGIDATPPPAADAGADALNGMELARLRAANAAYARAAASGA